jgi:hypothetical protein
MARIAFENKESTRSSSLPAKNQVKDADLNEIKTSVNSLYDDVDAIGVDVAAIVGNAPANMNTLEEISSSIGNDPDFVTTVGNALNNKEDSLPTMVGASLKVLRVNTGETAKEWVTISTAIEIGVTAITGGTTRRVPFNNAGVISESANLVFDASNQLVIGGHTGGARVDVKCGGALSTDLGLRVRNSAETFDTLKVKGDGTVSVVAGSTSGSLKALDVRYATDTISLLSVRGDGLVYFANDLSYFNPNTFRLNIEGAGIVNGTTSINLLATSGDVILSPSNAEKFRISSTVATFAEGVGIVLGTTTGTKIGTASSQKIGFWNATPIVQPTTSVASATLTGGGGATITDTDTFDGYTLKQIVKALRNSGLLA